MSDVDPEQTYIEKHGKLRLIAGFIGAPVIWLVVLQTNYVLVSVSCHVGSKFPLYISSLLFIAASVATGVCSWGNWVRAGLSWPGEKDGGVLGRSRFLGMLGVVTSAFFTLLILGQLLAIVVIDPCLE